MIPYGGIVKAEGEIASGGFGKVDRVRMKDGTLLARKTFSPLVGVYEPEVTAKLRKRFEREVNTQRLIESKSIMPIVYWELSGAQPWYLMPLADRNFADEIAQCKLERGIPQTGLADILNALEQLHELGYVHRDLKPSNVLFHEGVWKLTDFGLIHPISAETTQLTSTSSGWGTAAYCAPEQSISFGSVGTSADIYAFGCILHDIYSNGVRVPYARQTVSGDIGAIIEKCTEVKPERRYKSIQALRSSLLTLLSSATAHSATPKASGWARELKSTADWDAEKLKEFGRFVFAAKAPDDLQVVFEQYDDGAISKLAEVDQDTWKQIAMKYAEWVKSTNFAFEYCDVLAKRLELMFNLGDLECKGEIAIAVAELGRSHNRWFVMKSLVQMCGHELTDVAAQRIAIDIQATESSGSFRKCVEVLSLSVLSYHPKIAGVL